jgi:hypothetical protein
MTTIRADLIAAALSASAAVFGDDPDDALAADQRAGGPRRRAIAPACSGLARALGCGLVAAAVPFRVKYNTAKVARYQRRGRFAEAEAAAIAAVQALLSGRPSTLTLSIPAPAPQAVVPEPERTHEAAPGSLDYRRSPLPVSTDAVEGRVLAALAHAPANSCTLASIVNAKESAVCATLRILMHEGAVRADPVPPEGLRAQVWSIAA